MRVVLKFRDHVAVSDAPSNIEGDDCVTEVAAVRQEGGSESRLLLATSCRVCTRAFEDRYDSVLPTPARRSLSRSSLLSRNRLTVVRPSGVRPTNLSFS